MKETWRETVIENLKEVLTVTKVKVDDKNKTLSDQMIFLVWALNVSYHEYSIGRLKNENKTTINIAQNKSSNLELKER